MVSCLNDFLTKCWEQNFCFNSSLLCSKLCQNSVAGTAVISHCSGFGGWTVLKSWFSLWDTGLQLHSTGRLPVAGMSKMASLRSLEGLGFLWPRHFPPCHSFLTTQQDSLCLNGSWFPRGKVIAASSSRLLRARVLILLSKKPKTNKKTKQNQSSCC